MSVQHFFSSIFNCNLVYLMTIQLCQREFITLRKKINICRTNRQKIQISRNVLSSQKKTNQNKQKQGLQKKMKIVLPQHPKKDKMTTKCKLIFFYKYSEISLIQMSRLKWSHIYIVTSSSLMLTQQKIHRTCYWPFTPPSISPPLFHSLALCLYLYIIAQRLLASDSLRETVL